MRANELPARLPQAAAAVAGRHADPRRDFPRRPGESSWPASQKVTFRTHEQVSRFFASLDLVDPGVVPIQDWRADSALNLSSAPTAMWGGVGRKT